MFEEWFAQQSQVPVFVEVLLVNSRHYASTCGAALCLIAVVYGIVVCVCLHVGEAFALRVRGKGSWGSRHSDQPFRVVMAVWCLARVHGSSGGHCCMIPRAW